MKSIYLILGLTFLSSCCKCVGIYKTTIFLEGFSVEEIQNPYVVIFKPDVSDTITLSIDTKYQSTEDMRLNSEKYLNHSNQWKICINDTLNYSIGNFNIGTETKGCCKGTNYLVSYSLNGEVMKSNVVEIKK